MPDTEFQRLIQAFPSNPFAVSRLFRDLQETDPATFLGNAIGVLRDAPETPGARCVATLLTVRPDSIPIAQLADPSVLDLATAVRVAKAIQSRDSLLDQKFLDHLSVDNLPFERQLRILEILEQVAAGPRILSAYRRFAHSAEPDRKSVV